jgi:hypothetical protein
MTREEMKRRQARAVLALGVAGGRAHVCVEKQAVNEAAYPIADDAGRVLHGVLDAQRVDRLAVTGFSAAGMARAMRRTGPGSRVSRDAGRYVCNHFYFMLLHNINGRAVFVHLPRLPDEAARLGGGPGLSLEAAEAAGLAGISRLPLCLKVIVENVLRRHAVGKAEDSEIDELEKRIFEHEPKVNAFLIAKGQIAEGQTFRDIADEGYRNRVLSNTPRFIDAVLKEVA